MKKVAKRFVTLIEMMIVMFLIALIIGVVAYNYQGTLEEGKAFKTKTGKEKLETILNLVVSERPEAEDDIEIRWADYVKVFSPCSKCRHIDERRLGTKIRCEI